VEVMIKAAGDAGNPFIFTSGSATFGVFTKGEASPTSSMKTTPSRFPRRYLHRPRLRYRSR